jgi:NAD(P)-dependent dehydrogenase (short-subunit alcohol dehydrogenase family)
MFIIVAEYLDVQSLAPSQAREILFRDVDNSFILYLSDDTATFNAQERIIRLEMREARAHEFNQLAFGGRTLRQGAEVADRGRHQVPGRGVVQTLAERAFKAFGGVHVLCNNAGVAAWGGLERATHRDWQWVLGVNLWGVIHGVHAFLPIMLRQGTPAHIVNTASIAGLVSGVAYLGPYAVAKVGVVSLSETLRTELAASDAAIGVSVLCPSATNTNVMEGERNRPDHLGTEERTAGAEAWREAIRSGFTGPSGKEPHEVAAMVVDAVKKNRFWIVSHSDLRPALEHRFAEILGATPYGF